MRKLLFFLSVATCAGAWPSGYSTFFTITVNSGQVPATLANFPMYFAGNSILKSATNGGCAQNAAGYDVIFASDAAGASLLNFELASGTYTPATGAGEWWINVPSLSNGTVIYGACGNASVSTQQGGGASAWNSSFAGVWHTQNIAAFTDSTSNGNTGANHSASNAAGKIAGGSAVNGSSGITIPSVPSLQPATLTLSMWVLAASASQASYGRFLSKGTDQVGPPYGSYTLGFYASDATSFGFGLGFADNTMGYVNSAHNSCPVGTWCHVAGTYDGSTLVLYVNGAPAASTAVSKTITYTGPSALNLPLCLGCDSSGAGLPNGYSLNGSFDEVHLANTALTANWIKAEYNNQSAPSSFYTFGNSSGAGQIRHKVVGQ